MTDSPDLQGAQIIMAESDAPFVSLLILLTALLLSLSILTQTLSSYASAYISAPQEINTFIDAADFSIQENESYERDITIVQRLEDKLRLGRLLREIQRCGDDLREELNRLLIDGDKGGTRLRSRARLLWKSRRTGLEERVKRGDLLRMRFLVVYMGLVASNGTVASAPTTRDPEKSASERSVPKMTIRPSLPHALTDGITRKPPPMRRLATPAMGHNEGVSGVHRMGWAGVVQELQRSPKMHKRHASIETAMGDPR
ncbi:MAG: hypothetical protein M1818_004187 [Claussenomyces sp. TS43310]|nr:MAG: hypothetical protein M1818_004187 [Claussenomyces sp. TS43310]